MLKAPVEDCVAKNADSAVPERKRAPKKAKKGKEDATQTEPAAAARGKTVQQAARKGKGGAKPAGQAEADLGDQAPEGSGGAKRSRKKKAAAPAAGGEGGTQSDERVEDKGKDPMDESLTDGRKDEADRRKSLAKTPKDNKGAKNKKKKGQGGTSGGSGDASTSNADRITSWVAQWKKDEKAEQQQYQEAYLEKFGNEPPETRENPVLRQAWHNEFAARWHCESVLPKLRLASSQLDGLLLGPDAGDALDNLEKEVMAANVEEAASDGDDDEPPPPGQVLQEGEGRESFHRPNQGHTGGPAGGMPAPGVVLVEGASRESFHRSTGEQGTYQCADGEDALTAGQVAAWARSPPPRGGRAGPPILGSDNDEPQEMR